MARCRCFAGIKQTAEKDSMQLRIYSRILHTVFYKKYKGGSMKRSVRKESFHKVKTQPLIQAGFMIRATAVSCTCGDMSLPHSCFAKINLYQITWGRILISGRLLLHSMEWGSTHEGHMKLRKAPIFGTAQYIVLLIRAVKQKNSFFF